MSFKANLLNIFSKFGKYIGDWISFLKSGSWNLPVVLSNCLKMINSEHFHRWTRYICLPNVIMFFYRVSCCYMRCWMKTFVVAQPSQRFSSLLKNGESTTPLNSISATTVLPHTQFYCLSCALAGRKLKEKFGINSYPYFAYFRKGKFKYQYNGQPLVDDIVAFMKK